MSWDAPGLPPEIHKLWNMEKYILSFEHVNLDFWTNMYILQFGQIHLAIWSNAFCNLAKYDYNFGQIRVLQV